LQQKYTTNIPNPDVSSMSFTFPFCHGSTWSPSRLKAQKKRTLMP